MIHVHSHKSIERYEVSCDTEEGIKSLKDNLIYNFEFTLVKEWWHPFDGKIHFFALFERDSKNLLAETVEEEA